MRTNITRNSKRTYLFYYVVRLIRNMESQFIDITYIKDKLIDFLIQHNVLSTTTSCNECGSVININKETLMFMLE